MSENEITVDGVKYVAVVQAGCAYCAFRPPPGNKVNVCNLSANPVTRNCGAVNREDGRSVIWMTMTSAAVHRLKGTA